LKLAISLEVGFHTPTILAVTYKANIESVNKKPRSFWERGFILLSIRTL
jgi:hypothetical protein